MRSPLQTHARHALALGIVLLVMAVTRLPFWEMVEGRTFDFLSTIGQPAPAQPGFVIVAIDEPSFSAIGKPWPWSRSLHAELISELRRAGAGVIGFDIVFAEPSDPQADAALAAAADERTVFAADESVLESEHASSIIRTEPLPELLAGGARVGVTAVSLDKDGVARRIARYPNSFPRELLLADGRQLALDPTSTKRIQYFGPAGTYPRVSYYQALRPADYLPPDYLRGKDVIVGFALQAAADVRGGTDMLETPHTLHTGQLTPGVEIQATIADNLLHDLAIEMPPEWSALLMVMAAGVIGYAASRPSSPVRKILLTVAVVGAFAALSWLALRWGRVWLSPAEPSASLIGVVAALATLDFAAEQRRRREVQMAFSQYISPAMVERLVANPSLLKLGGERKMMTLLFADIRGFTSISEAMKDDPEGLTSLVNDILSPLSEIVIRHGGTIDKYMGDCIMAFWNAPLDDSEHALHGVQAGIEMVQAIPALNASILERIPGKEESKRAIRIGVGINSGECVVGNMGSRQRFDYSVLGDAVNVASRIEGLCKQYDVPLIIGESTAERVRDQLQLMELDHIAVRGKATPTALYFLDAAGFRPADRRARAGHGDAPQRGELA
jgi:adenylate cyclase